MVPNHFGVYVLAAALVVSLGLVAVGALRVVRSSGSLKRRLDAYAELPVLQTLELTESRVAFAQQSAAGLPRLRARAEAAIAEIVAARNRTRMIVQSLRFVVRNLLVSR